MHFGLLNLIFPRFLPGSIFSVLRINMCLGGRDEGSGMRQKWARGSVRSECKRQWQTGPLGSHLMRRALILIGKSCQWTYQGFQKECACNSCVSLFPPAYSSKQQVGLDTFYRIDLLNTVPNPAESPVLNALIPSCSLIQVHLGLTRLETPHRWSSSSSFWNNPQHLTWREICLLNSTWGVF